MKKKTAKKLYKKFHGVPARREKTVNLGELGTLTRLGSRVISIAYEAEKEHLGDTKPIIYEHEFEHHTELYTNGKILIIAGRRIKINEEGIHG